MVRTVDFFLEFTFNYFWLGQLVYLEYTFQFFLKSLFNLVLDRKTKKRKGISLLQSAVLCLRFGAHAQRLTGKCAVAIRVLAESLRKSFKVAFSRTFIVSQGLSNECTHS